MEFEVVCPFHRMHGDTSGTRCKKVRRFTPENEQWMLRWMRTWCLLGRSIPAENGRISHRDVGVFHEPYSEAELVAYTPAEGVGVEWLGPALPAPA
eukprot:7134416-Lingulodinium_polyedra.AAC.1